MGIEGKMVIDTCKGHIQVCSQDSESLIQKISGHYHRQASLLIYISICNIKEICEPIFSAI